MEEPIPAPPEFATGDRYEIVRCLGQGGFGVVWEAWDRELGRAVALKTLRATEASALLRFKNEFRALVDLSHPNLVQLHELAVAGDAWFFTMALVEGERFVQYVRQDYHPGENTTYDLSVDTLDDLGDGAPALAPPLGALGQLDVARLRAALRQLVDGVRAMHAAGLVHRDLKPSNLLVSAQGRVSILDFGLAAPLDGARSALESRIGTPIYMAPEQATGSVVTEATDWYAVGVILFEALTGTVPYRGSSTHILESKVRWDAPDARELNPDAPEDLAALCAALLARDPAARPDGEAVRAAVGGAVQSGPRTSLFVGRERELVALRNAWAGTADGPVAALLVGGSGMGKTALAQRFLGEIRDRGAVVLAGRCFERESVPFKAVDDLVDHLADLLVSLPDAERAPFVGPDAALLGRVFPSLRVIPGFEATADDGVLTPAIRRHAAAALRQVLVALLGRGRVCLFLDDVQWGDADSAALLEELFRESAAHFSAPGEAYRHRLDVLVVATCRAEGLASPIVTAFGDLAPALRTVRVQVGELSPGEAATLARTHVGDDDPRLARILAEAGGHPYFLDSLLRDVERGRSAGTLQELLALRLGDLPAEARELLAYVAVDGRPLPRAVLTAAGAPGGEEPLGVLRAGQFVRVRGGPGAELVEPWHDRLREAVVMGLEPEVRRAVHLALARALDDAGADPERRLLHWRGAGDTERTRALALDAAESAAAHLAFHRAAELYELACKAGASGAAVYAALAEARVNCGRCLEAAAAYLEAADASEGDHRVDLRRRAAEQLLVAGQIDRGLDVLREVLPHVGLRLPSGPYQAIPGLLANRARLWARGLEPSPARPIAPRDALRIDTCWSVASALGVVDTLRATDFQVRHILLALDAGDPYRVARALALEAGYLASEGIRAEPATRAVLLRAAGIADAAGHPHARAFVRVTRGLAHYIFGQYRAAHATMREAEQLLLRECKGVAWELGTTAMFQIEALTMLGRWDAVALEIPGRMREARQTGNLHLESFLQYIRSSTVLLGEDRPDDARAEIERVLRHQTRRGFHLSHWWGTFTHCQALLYSGAAEAAWARFGADWPAIRGSLMMRVPAVAIPTRYQRGRLALAHAATRSGAERWWLVRTARGEAAKIDATGEPWGVGMAHLLRAGAARASGDDVAAERELSAAIASLEANEMALMAAAARFQHGGLVGGDAGAAERAEAELVMRRLGARRPEQIAAMYAPFAGPPTPPRRLSASS